MKLDKVTRTLAKAVHNECKHVKDYKLWEMQCAFRSKSMRQAWMKARNLTGTQRGSTRSWRRCPITSNPNLQQYKDEFAKHSKDGGWQATVVLEHHGDFKASDVASEHDNIIREFEGDAFPQTTNFDGVQLGQIVAQDFQHLAWMSRQEKNNKAVPEFPLGAFQCRVGSFCRPRVSLLLLSSRVRDASLLGSFLLFLGKFMRGVLYCHFASGIPPKQQIFSMTWDINKKSISHFIDEFIAMDVRHIFGFNSIDKIYIKQQHQLASATQPFDSEFGGIPGTSREEAILQPAVMCLRLDKAHIITG